MYGIRNTDKTGVHRCFNCKTKTRLELSPESSVCHDTIMGNIVSSRPETVQISSTLSTLSGAKRAGSGTDVNKKISGPKKLQGEVITILKQCIQLQNGTRNSSSLKLLESRYFFPLTYISIKIMLSDIFEINCIWILFKSFFFIQEFYRNVL